VKKSMFIFCMVAALLGAPLSAVSMPFHVSSSVTANVVTHSKASIKSVASKSYFRQGLNYAGRKAKDMAHYLVFENPYVGLAVAVFVIFYYSTKYDLEREQRGLNELSERQLLNIERLEHEQREQLELLEQLNHEREWLERERNELAELHERLERELNNNEGLERVFGA